MKILVSACLLGIACKYSGGDNVCPALLNAVQHSGHTFIPICPEVYGGLPTPRPPAERTGDCVLTETGTDVTAQYQRGAEAALQLAQLWLRHDLRRHIPAPQNCREWGDGGIAASARDLRLQRG